MVLDTEGKRLLSRRVLNDEVRVPVRARAESTMLVRSAVACNSGTFYRAREVGVTAVKVFDRPNCGETHHRNPDKATGMLRPVEEAAAGTIAHPRCTRAFGPLPNALRLPTPSALVTCCERIAPQVPVAATASCDSHF